ncbi:MASE1 domain-containing protein [Kamptonema animale CS-326]|jgi:PAS domain S-box-containing protein|uniref:sensor histidine kinase n=1 Tax=Kamptonema animale TaxID=92934 RepID=UPI00232C7BDC|nr:MASE1 domain-containing protein [Kamptonema animale]MDB9513205.1 MASE1 domain-containing protein [Kamptonema animale CS-326]
MKLLNNRYELILHIGILALAYLLTGKLAASMLGLVKAEASPVWPPAGIALGAMLLKGPRIWPGVAIGSFVLNSTGGVAIPWPAIATSAFSVTLQAIAGKMLLDRIGFSPRLERLRDVMALLAGAVISTIVVATLGNLSGCIFGLGKWSNFWTNWWTTWIGDGMGILIVTPLLLMGSLGIKSFKLKIKNTCYPNFNFKLFIANYFEVSIWLSLLIGVSLLVFCSKNDAAIALYPLEYLPFPLVVWAALRFGQKGAVLASVIVSTLAIFGAVQGGGPFVTKSLNLNQAVLFLQVFMGAIASTALILAAAVAERQQALVDVHRTASLLRESEASLANAQRIAQLGNWDLKYAICNAPGDNFHSLIDYLSAPKLRGEIKSIIELRWSAELYRLLGYSPSCCEPSEEAFLRAVHPEDRELVARSHQRAVFEQKHYCIEYRIVLPDGSDRTLREHSAFKQNGIAAVVQDITERKRTEEALRMSAWRDRLLGEIALRIRRSLDLDQILNTTVAEVRQFLKADRAFITTLNSIEESQVNPQYSIIVAESVNPVFPTILGWKFADENHINEVKRFYAHNAVRAIADTTQIEIPAAMVEYYKDYQVRATLNVPIMLGEQLFGLLVVNQCSGTRHWQEFEIDLLEKLATQVAIALQQAQLLKQVTTLNANLERQVEERTQELQQKMQELQESNRLKDLFIHAVSHNLRTPLMGMLILLKSLLSKPCTGNSTAENHQKIPVLRSILERMVQGSEHQLSMVNSLLDAHASEVNGIVLNCTPLQLSDLSADVVKDLEHILGKNNATLTQSVPTDLPLVNGDAKQLRRVFENLLTNALKHNPPGINLSLKIDVINAAIKTRQCSIPHPSTYTLGKSTSESNIIRCTIEDNGVGISPQQCASLFELYVQDPNNRQLTGLGLGLYISRQIIKAHGGEMGVDSNLGVGSKFWFTLPIPNYCLNYEI